LKEIEPQTCASVSADVMAEVDMAEVVDAMSNDVRALTSSAAKDGAL
jgi:hypothetical protein